MFVQVRLECKCLLTLLTFVVLEGRMGLHVSPQVGAVGKGLPAVGAPEGLLTCVRAHMSLQEPRPAKGLAADVTLVPEVVRQDVHGQGGHGDVGLAAGRALPRHLAVQAAVRLLVPAEVGGSGVRLATFTAGVAVTATTLAFSAPPRPSIGDEKGIH